MGVEEKGEGMNKLLSFKKQKLIYLKWQDAHSNASWFSEKELEKKINEQAFICEQVGWIIYEDEKEIHLISRRATWDKSSDTEIDEYGMYQRIPQTWILKRKEIKL